MIKSDPLSVLLSVRKEMDTSIDEDILKSCYQLQSDHQYDRDRNTIKEMQALVEDAIVKGEGSVIL